MTACIAALLANAVANNYVVLPAVPTDITALDMLFSALKSVPGGLDSVNFTKNKLLWKFNNV